MNAAHYDAVVIGSGFGGSLVAHALVQAGLKTALLERGQWAKRDDADWDQRTILLQKRYRAASPLLVKQYGRRTFQRTYPNEVVGGNSVFYGGASLRLRPADFARWPLSYADLAPYYARAEQLLEVHGEAGTDPYQPPGIDAYPRRAVELSAPAQRIHQAGTALGFQPFKIPLAINFSDRTRPLCLRCITCDGFPCKVEAKNDMASTLLAAAAAAGLEIIVGAVAQRLVQRGGRVEQVEYVDSASRQAHALSADLVVLAAGALNSPALMLRSGFDHPLIGRFLMRHCNGIANCIFPFRTNPQQVFHKQLCFSDFYEDLRAELGTAVGVIQDIYTPAPPIIRHHAPWGFKTLVGLLTGYMQNLLCIAEDDPRRENRVSLASEQDVFGMELVQVEHAYSNADCRRRDHLLAKAEAVLRQAGGLLRYRYLIDSFSHAISTLRCATTPEEGVLDLDCRYWGSDNLYVSDGSFMPSSGGVNPSLTIAANALRVAERILGKAMKKVCLVGCGTIGRLHAKNLVGKVELSFHSRTQASAEALSRQCGGGQVFASYAEVLDSAVDAVLISSPPDAHRPQVIEALAAGKGVLVEKPLCATEGDLAAISAAAADHPDALMMIAENYYYKPVLKLLKWIIRQGFIGQVQQATLGKRFTQQAAGWKSGYGALLEGGIHFVALGADLFADAPRQVTAEFPEHRVGEPERNSIVRVEYASGAKLVLRYAWNAFSLTKGTFQHARIVGTEGRVIFECNGLYARLRGRRKRLYFPGVGDLMGYGGMMRDFLQCLQEPGRQPYSDLARAERDLSIVFAAYKHIKD